MNIWEIHPALVHFPLTLYLVATVLDFVGVVRRRQHLVRAASFTLVAAIISAGVAALAGLVAYLTVPPHSEAAHVRILVHTLLAVSATITYGIVLLLHSRPPSQANDRRRLTASVLGALLLTGAGALGGYVVYQDGVGVEKPVEPELATWKVHLQNLLDGEHDDD